MIESGISSDWPKKVIGFISNRLPLGYDSQSWEHQFSSAYQLGCEALVKLGYADETDYGAILRNDPQLPSELPRWDDICVVVLSLANQQGGLDYRLIDDNMLASQPSLDFVRVGGSTPPQPNITPAAGLGPAYAETEVLEVLKTLGLIVQNCWTDIAELVMWRILPKEWKMDLGADTRFKGALAKAISTIPNDVRIELDQLTVISDANIAEYMALSVAAHNESRAKFGPKAMISEPSNSDQARRALISGRENDLDWLFYRYWRFSEGWLKPTQRIKALEVFHDSLAIMMRRSVIKQLYPDALVVLT